MRLFAVGVVCALGVAGLGFAQKAKRVVKQLPPPADIAALRDSAEKVLKRYRMQGVGMAVVRGDSLEWAGGVGLADVASGRPATANTLFRAGSITKSFVALGIVRLQAQGKLKLDDPISKYVPEVEVSNPWGTEHPVTIAQLLEHTSGYDDMHFRELTPKPEEGVRPEVALGVSPSSRAVRRQPGTYFSYSNPGYTVLGHLIEKCSGQPWEQYLTDQLLVPLGMKQSHFARPNDPRDSLAIGYAADSTALPYFDIYHRPAGVLMTTAPELARLVLLMLREGVLDGQRVVSTAELQRIQHGQTYHPKLRSLSTHYGLGSYSDLSAGYHGHGHDGGIDGFVASYRYYPKLGAGYVVLVNSSETDAGFRKLKNLARDYVLAGQPKPQPEPIVPTTDASAYAGIYEPFVARNEITSTLDRIQALIQVQVMGDTLIVRPLLQNDPDTLVHTGSSRYRGLHEALSTAVLFEDGDDRIFGKSTPLRRVPTWWAYLGLGTTVLVLLLACGGILSAIVWGLIRLGSRDRWSSARWWLTLPGVGVIGTVVLFTWIGTDGVLGLQGASNADWRGILLAVLTVIVPLGTVIGLFLLARHWQWHSVLLRSWLIALAFGGLVSSVWLYHAHWLPLALWWW